VVEVVEVSTTIDVDVEVIVDGEEVDVDEELELELLVDDSVELLEDRTPTVQADAGTIDSSTGVQAAVMLFEKATSMTPAKSQKDAAPLVKLPFSHARKLPAPEKCPVMDPIIGETAKGSNATPGSVESFSPLLNSSPLWMVKIAASEQLVVDAPLVPMKV